MWQLKDPDPVKLIMGILAADRNCLHEAVEAVVDVYKPPHRQPPSAGQDPSAALRKNREVYFEEDGEMDPEHPIISTIFIENFRKD